MSARSLVFLGMFIGSTVGGYLPTLFGVGMFSYTAVLTSGIGAIIGVIIAYKLSNY